MALPLPYFGNNHFSVMDAFLRMLLFSLCFANFGHAQLAWLNPELHQEAYTYTRSIQVARPLGNWAFEQHKPLEFGVGRWNQAMERRLFDEQGKLKEVWYYQLGGNGQLHRIQRVNLPEGDTISYRYEYSDDGLLSRVTEKQPGQLFSYAFRYRASAELEQNPEGIPHWPARSGGKDTVLAQSELGRAHWLIRSKAGRLIEYLQKDSAGAILQHWHYRYQVEKGGSRIKRLGTNQLTGQQVLTERLLANEGEVGRPPELREARWWADWGAGTSYFLRPNGQLAALMPGDASEPVFGEWEERSGRLVLKPKNRREALAYTLEPDGPAWQLNDQDESRVWLPQSFLGPLSRQHAELEARMERSDWKAYEEQGRWGLRHRLDGRTLPARYDAAAPFGPSCAIVRLEGLEGLVHYNGQAITPIYYQELKGAGGSRLIANKEGRVGMINTQGDTLLPFEFDRLHLLEDGRLKAVKDGKMGLLDASGELVIPFRFDTIGLILEGRAIAWQGGQPGIIDSSGQWLLEAGQYAAIAPTGSGHFLVRSFSGQWGAVDQYGEAVVPLQYQHLRFVEPFFFLGQQQGEFGLFRADGTALTPFYYRSLKVCDERASGDLCQNMRQQKALAQFISGQGFGYLDGYGREHPPALPDSSRLAAEYERVQASEELAFTFPKAKWRFEPSVQRLYKQGDYGRVRIRYEVISLGAQSPETWLEAELSAAQFRRLQRDSLNRLPAYYYVGKERVRYYDFYKKHWWVPLSAGQLLHLSFSCKEDNYLENAQDLYEIEQLLSIAP